MMVINNKYEHGQIVYLVTDPEQLARMVTKISVYADNSISYQLSSGTDFSDHFELEISERENVEMK